MAAAVHEHGAAVLAQTDHLGRTLLHHAAIHGRTVAMHSLLEVRASTA